MDLITAALHGLVEALNGLAIGGVALAFLALAGIGTVTMATVQLLKELTPLRRNFQQSSVQKWLDARASLTTLGPRQPDDSSMDLLSVWADLAVDGNLRALFTPPAEEMAAYLKQSIPVMIDEARRYHPLIEALALNASPEDLAIVVEGQTSTNKAEYFDARSRVSRRIERSLEGLRLDISDRWKFRMQMSSLVLTVVIVECAVFANGHAPVAAYVLAVPLGLIGGYFSPVLRDVVGLLQKLRQA